MYNTSFKIYINFNLQQFGKQFSSFLHLLSVMGMCGIFFYFLISQQNSAELKPKLVFEAIDGMAKFIHFHPILWTMFGKF